MNGYQIFKKTSKFPCYKIDHANESEQIYSSDFLGDSNSWFF